MGKFMCRNHGNCLNLSKVCDGVPDCSDGSDESESCHMKNDCSSKQCPPGATCHMLPTSGAECICPSGFRLVIYQNKCEDINECQERDDLCSQRCENTSGGFRCACDAGYELDTINNRTCHATDTGTKQRALLLYTTQVAVVGMHLPSHPQSHQQNHIFTVASNLSKVIGVAYDGEYIYWTNIQNEAESIVRAHADGSNAEILLTSGLDAPEDLAVDWLTHNIYFSDNIMRHIAVCSSDALTCVVLVTQDVHQPRGLALWPQRGQMFWTDWGNKPMIARASMDGSRSRPIVSDNIHWPNGIALDMHQERIYWVDAKLGTVETARSDGTARRTVLDGMLKHPYGLAVFEDQLYWSDWGTKSVHACHKFSGNSIVYWYGIAASMPFMSIIQQSSQRCHMPVKRLIARISVCWPNQMLVDSIAPVRMVCNCQRISDNVARRRRSNASISDCVMYCWRLSTRRLVATWSARRTVWIVT